ncbi:gamma-glutamylcyclotransferase [Marinobacter sp.]|uniref:gamma-glutamylcyclotransferase family protein n=1 Tax=Marinobacter sp. TaxID=50741 RepID=UPI0035679A26
MMLRPYRVAVYGTLKRHHSNHRVLAGARFVGECSLNSIVLYDLGPYPGAKLERSQGVVTEVYEVDGTTFARLDALEGYDAASPDMGLYDRKLVETPLGEAWVYIYNHAVPPNGAIRCGGWPR